jgi:two-component sensor histidine kinase
VRVELSRVAGDRATMVVHDQGRGFASEPAPGFGLDIIRLFTSQLGATLTLTGDGGVTARVEFAIPAEGEAAT